MSRDIQLNHSLLISPTCSIQKSRQPPPQRSRGTTQTTRTCNVLEFQMTTDDDSEDKTIKVYVLGLLAKGANSLGAYGAMVVLLIIRSCTTWFPPPVRVSIFHFLKECSQCASVGFLKFVISNFFYNNSNSANLFLSRVILRILPQVYHPNFLAHNTNI